jgi:hypothetical protein
MDAPEMTESRLAAYLEAGKQAAENSSQPAQAKGRKTRRAKEEVAAARAARAAYEAERVLYEGRYRLRSEILERMLEGAWKGATVSETDTEHVLQLAGAELHLRKGNIDLDGWSKQACERGIHHRTARDDYGFENRTCFCQSRKGRKAIKST